MNNKMKLNEVNGNTSIDTKNTSLSLNANHSLPNNKDPSLKYIDNPKAAPMVLKYISSYFLFT